MRLAVSAGELLRSVDAAQMKTKVPMFAPGDTLRVTIRIPEGGTKERLQVFEGIVIGRRGGGSREMVTIRKVSFGIGVERMFPIYSPFLAKIEVVAHSKVRRAKLYYLRGKIGKASRLKQQFGGEQPMDVVTAAPVAAEPGAEAAPAAPKAEKPAKAKKDKAEAKAAK